MSTGADIDRSELLLRFAGQEVRGVALVAFMTDQEAESEDLKRSLVCRKILLQAGADPTVLTSSIDPDDNSTSMLVDALGMGTLPGSAVGFSSLWLQRY